MEEKQYDKYKVLSINEFVKVRTGLKEMGYTNVPIKRLDEISSYKHTPRPSITDESKPLYIYKSQAKCILVFYILNKRYQMIFTSKKPEMAGMEAYREFRRIAKTFGEELPIDGLEGFSNGVYSYFTPDKKLLFSRQKFTSLDQNRCYSYMLMQPVADYRTKTPCTFEDTLTGENEFYKAEGILLNGTTVNEIIHKDNKQRLKFVNSSYVNFFKYDTLQICPRTVKFITDKGNKADNPEDYAYYKDLMNKFIGCLKRNGIKQSKTNCSTAHASLYARNEVQMEGLVNKFTERGYKVMLVNTDAIKIVGKYNTEDNLVTLGSNVGEFKIEVDAEEGEFQSKGVYQMGDKTVHMSIAKNRQDGLDALPELTFEPENFDTEMPIYKEFFNIKGEKK